MAKSTTPPPDPFEDTPAPASTGPTQTGSLPTDDYKTTQETSGKDPVDPPVNFDPVPKPHGIGPGEPYPTGNPPPDPHYHPEDEEKKP